MNQFRQRRLIDPVVAVIAAAVLMAASAGTASARVDQGGVHQLTHITVGIAVLVPSMTPFYLAKEKGFYAKQGLDVNIVAFNGGSEVVKALVGGSIQIGVSALPEVILANNQGQGVKVVYGGFDMPVFEWWAKPGINSFADAKGKKWGISRFGSSTHFLTRYVTAQHGLDPDKDVQFVQAGADTNQYAALQAGQIDVAILAPPVQIQAKRDGFHLLYKQTELMPGGYPFHVIDATDDYFKHHSYVVAAFLKGTVAGIDYTLSSPKAAQQVIVNDFKVDPSLADDTYKADFGGGKLYANGRLPASKDMATFFKIGIQNDQWTTRPADSTWLFPNWIKQYPKWLPASLRPKPTKKK